MGIEYILNIECISGVMLKLLKLDI